jgi:hypothetical protein
MGILGPVENLKGSIAPLITTGTMRLLHGDFAFELSDDWLMEAGMDGFVPTSRSFRVDRNAFPRCYNVQINAVKPVRRDLSHGVFGDDADRGLGAKDRAIKILRGFLNDDFIPPVEVVRMPSGSGHQFRLVHGAHRFYLSIAAGFTEIPAVDGFDPNA